MSGRSGLNSTRSTIFDKRDMLEACMHDELMTSRSAYPAVRSAIDESDSDGVTALQIAAAKGHRQTGELSV